MNKELKQFIEELKSVNLESEEKIEIRNFLFSFIEKKPANYVSKEILERLKKQRQNILSSYVLSFYKKPMLAIIIPIIIAISGGVSVAAENSLPGDFLFPVKVKVNEEIRSVVALTPKAKAKWEIKVVERRLEEAEKLSAEGRLKAEVSAKIEENFKAHSDRVQERIAEFKAEDRAEVSSNFETSLNAHEAILEKLLLEFYLLTSHNA